MGLSPTNASVFLGLYSLGKSRGPVNKLAAPMKEPPLSYDIDAAPRKRQGRVELAT